MCCGVCVCDFISVTCVHVHLFGDTNIRIVTCNLSSSILYHFKILETRRGGSSGAGRSSKAQKSFDLYIRETDFAVRLVIAGPTGV